MMYCESCQIEYPEGKKFCRQCGDSLEPKPAVSAEEAIRCPHCEAPVSPGDAFCDSCGASLGEQAGTGQDEEEVFAEKTGRSQPAVAVPANEAPRCPECGGQVLPGDVACESCGASLVDEEPPAFASRRVVEPHRTEQGEEEALFALEDELKQQRRGLLRGVGTGIGAGLLLTGLVVGGFYVYQTRFSPAPLVVPPAPVLPAGQVMTAEELGLKIAGAGAQDPGRSLATLRDQVETHFPKLKELYDRSLQTDPALKGAVTLHMTVAPGGEVTYVRATPVGISDATFVASVQTEAQTWRFPLISAGITSVHYPLLFYPPGTDPKTLIAALPAAKSEEPPGPSDQQDVPSGEKGFPRKYRVTYPTNVRDKPTWASKAVADLQEGTKITVVGREGDWLKVQPKNPENPPGYVWKDHAVAQ